MERIRFEGCEVAVALHMHGEGEDLLSAGLGLSGLQAPIPPLDAVPDWAGRRRRAIHANWKGIAHLADPDAWTRSALARPIGGRELHARLQLADGSGHRIMLQVPDGFDPQRPRLLVTAASGSRGVFGAVALASCWGLPRGYAVVHTDKGCGTDWFDVDSGTAPDLLGAFTDDPARQLFRPATTGVPRHAVLIPHAHSQHHPEAHWGEYVRQAQRFAWVVLDALFLRYRPSAQPRRRSLAVGLSNGGAAVLRALERAVELDAAVVLAPNVLPAWGGGRSLLDYAAEAALWMPLAMQVPWMADAVACIARLAPPDALERQAEASRKALRALGWHKPGPGMAWRQLRWRGWPARTLGAAAFSTVFDFWLSACHCYSAAWSCAPPGRPPLGAWYAMLDAQGCARASTPLERALWWSDGAGIVPGAGVGIVATEERAQTLLRLQRMLHGARRDPRLARGRDAVRCRPPARPLPLVLVHGGADGLIPPAFSSLPYARMLRAHGDPHTLELPAQAPHYDALLAHADPCAGLSPLLPHGFAALDRLDAALDRR